MSARTLMVNEGLLQEMEQRIAEVREKGSELVKAMGGKMPFPTGMQLVAEYSEAVDVLQEFGKQLFGAIDLCDPEDNELCRREEEDDEDEEENGEDGEDGEDDEEEPS